MEQIPEKSRRRVLNKRKLKRLFALIVCVYAIGMITSIIVRQESMLANQREQYESIHKQIEQVRLENEDLQRKIEFAKTDSYIERIARDQLGYVKEGEIKFVEQD